MEMLRVYEQSLETRLMQTVRKQLSVMTGLGLRSRPWLILSYVSTLLMYWLDSWPVNIDAL